jgi:hypothetical protein
VDNFRIKAMREEARCANNQALNFPAGFGPVTISDVIRKMRKQNLSPRQPQKHAQVRTIHTRRRIYFAAIGRKMTHGASVRSSAPATTITFAVTANVHGIGWETAGGEFQ